MKTLDEIALACKADKASDIHNYCWLYEECFGHLREKPCTILEIGVNTGASICMWEQAFPLAKVIGVDCRPKQVRFHPERAMLLWHDVTTPGAMEMIFEEGPFDVVIDDAEHTPECSRAILKCFPDHIKPGGWFVLEDIHLTQEFAAFARGFIQRLQHKKEVLPAPFPGAPKPYPRKWADHVPSFDRHIRKIVSTHGTMAIQRTL